MSRKRASAQRKAVGTAGTLVVGALVGAVAAVHWQAPATFGAVLGALLLYLVSCWRFPYARCLWCRGRTTARGDGSGHFRRVRLCWLCGGEDLRRLGARLLGRG
jgi:hypothetical protein